jgi:outer membrane protein assembly factor BamB
MARGWIVSVLFLPIVMGGCTTAIRGPAVSVSHTVTPDAIYVADSSGRIHSFGTDGREAWVYPLADELARSYGRSSRDFQVQSLVAEGDKLYGLAVQLTGGHAGEVYLFALDGARLAWRQVVPTPTRQGRALAIGAQALFMAGDDGALYAFSLADGHLLWQHQTSGGPLGPPLVGADGNVYVVGAGNRLHAISPDGRELWRVEVR